MNFFLKSGPQGVGHAGRLGSWRGVFSGAARCGAGFAARRFGLVVGQIHAIGNRSLVIIYLVCRWAFVLALQMYYALVTYGAAESLG